MKSILTTLTLVSFLAPAAGFASGFDCSGDGYSVKLRNHVHAANGTENPAVLVVSNDEGTLVTRKGEEIRKNRRASTTQYVAEGSRKLDADSVIVQLAYKFGGEALENGEEVEGQLILVKDGEKSVHPISCARYLKK